MASLWRDGMLLQAKPILAAGYESGVGEDGLPFRQQDPQQQSLERWKFSLGVIRQKLVEQTVSQSSPFPAMQTVGAHLGVPGRERV